MVKDKKLLSRLSIIQESISNLGAEVSTIKTMVSSIMDKLESRDDIDSIIVDLTYMKLEISSLKALLNKFLSLCLASKPQKKMEFGDFKF
ncbi:MAG: hypothetical protein NDF55_06330 [archaeon GB-1867-005]|nr:hypothetical protein [Candidatus Culexmicrobium cathedralense]